jgi:hypothetical protein
VDANGRAWYGFLLVSRWLGFRLDLETSVILVVVAVTAVALSDSIGDTPAKSS